MLTELLSIVVPVYLCAGLGFVWVRAGRRYDTAFMTEMVMLVGAPCLTFSSLVGIEIGFGSLLKMAGAVVLATACMGIVAALALRVLRISLPTFLAPMTFGNTGNMGIPVCYFAFGDEGLVLGVCFYAATTLLQFTAGQWLWSGRISFVQLCRTPLTWASLLAIVVIAGDLEVPRWLLRTTTLMGDFTIPIMQFTLGVSLARLRLTNLPRSFFLSALKIGLGASVGFTLAEILGFEGVARGVLVLDCAMPVAVINYMFASSFNRSPNEVAGVVVLSTLLSFVTLPLILIAVLP